jgi:hypothetical protein
MPIALQLLMTRQAISPRFAIKILLNFYATNKRQCCQTRSNKNLETKFRTRYRFVFVDFAHKIHISIVGYSRRRFQMIKSHNCAQG